jgi:hypothetical protein
MSGWKKKASKWLLPLLLIATSSVGATSVELTRAIQLYYAGSPDAAISSIKSLALAGDAEAQLTLGNILYSLSKANKDAEIEDFINWYEMAAAQGSVDANSALGAIYHNRWLESRSKEDAALAISYYEKAIEQGDVKAQGYLSKLRRRGRFAVGEKLIPEPGATPKPSVQTAQTSSEGSASKSDEKSSVAPVEAAPAKPAPAKAAPVKASPVKQDAGETYEVSTVQVNLTEIVNQCSNYTVAGFDYYGESIAGAFLVGSAKIRTIEPSSSQLNTRLIRLFHKQSSTVIFLALDKVPEAVASKLQERSDFAITGIVTRAQMIGSHCEISLSYQTAE